MKPENENKTRNLLKESLISIPDENFSDRIMERIHQEAKPGRSFLSSISVSWLFLVISGILVPFALTFLVNLIRAYHISLPLPDAGNLSIVFSSIFAVVILLLMNNLMILTFRKR